MMSEGEKEGEKDEYKPEKSAQRRLIEKEEREKGRK